MTARVIFSLTILVNYAHGYGFWLGDGSITPDAHCGQLTPWIVKMWVIGGTAARPTLKVTRPAAEVAAYCPKDERWAWVTRRLTTERWPPDHGLKTAVLLRSHLAGSGLDTVELDLEPLTTERLEWLRPWARRLSDGVREGTGLPMKIRYAVPPVATRPLPGYRLTEAEAEELYTISHGLDLMVYDTGLKRPSEYGELVRGNFLWASRTAKEGKPIVIGLPSYQVGRKGYHDTKVEHILGALDALKEIPVKDWENYCRGWVRFAIFADTRKPHEAAPLVRFHSFEKERCPKAK
jgi:hypothetical protein